MAPGNKVTLKRNLNENQGQVIRRSKEFEDILRNMYSLQQVTDKKNQSLQRFIATNSVVKIGLKG